MSNRLMGSLKTRNISQIITERIVTSILSGELLPGQRLPTEEEFAARIGAGKSSVREAIKILEALGVVEIRRADGTYVVDEFKGSMLDPAIYGILLAERQATDVIDFKVGVQRMAAEDLLGQEGAACASGVLDVLEGACSGSRDELVGALTSAEMTLATKVANPLVSELYHQSIRIAAHQQEMLAETLVRQGRAEAAGEWTRAYASALDGADRARVLQLLEVERRALCDAVK